MIKKTLAAVILIILFAVLFVFFWWQSQLSAVNKNSIEPKAFVVAKGEGVSEVATKLKKENLIKSKFVFKVYARQSGLGGKIQAGTFKLYAAQSTPEIMKILTENPLDLWVTLIEGWRVEEMAEELNNKLGYNQADFLKLAKEGYMFPDSYLFPIEMVVSDVVGTLEATFEKRFSSDLRSKIRSQGLTEDEGVILASIVEREARSDKVRTEVASILLKRLKIDMGLNADATIQYALGFQPTEKTWWKRHLTKDDLKINSPYNTYLHHGLPPTPICNPSLSSLQAVANANPNTPYLYYYHDAKGNSHYAKTLEEHNQNVANNP